MFRLFRRDREKGAVLVEFAVILPLFILLIFGIMEAGWFFAQQVEVRNAAREGARLAVVDFPNGSSGTPVDGQAQIISETCRRADLTGDSVTVTLSKEGSGTSEAAVVTVASPYTSLTGVVDFFDGTITSTAIMRVERDSVTWSNGSAGCGP